MKIQNVSNNTFSGLAYPKSAHVALQRFIADAVNLDYSKIVSKQSNRFFASETKNIDAFVKNLQKAKEQYSKRNNDILSRFKMALEMLTGNKEKLPKLEIKYLPNKNTMVATINKTDGKTSQFIQRGRDNVFDFIRKINNAILPEKKILKY